MKKTMIAFCCILLAVTGCKKEKTLEEAMADIPEEIQYKLDNNIFWYINYNKIFLSKLLCVFYKLDTQKIETLQFYKIKLLYL